MKKPSLFFLSFFLLFSYSCKDKKKANSSLIDLGSEIDSLSIEFQPVLDRFDGWEHRNFYGIDISHYQGDVLNRMKTTDSLHFVITKATEGDSYIDPDFRKNWREIKDKGLIRGAYHFYRFNDDPNKQAEHFISQINDIEYSDIAPIVDVEAGSISASISKQKMHQDILSFIKQVESSLNRTPIIYTNTAFANEYLNNPDFANYELWLAEYTDGQPKVPETWKDKGYLIWQNSQSYNDFTITTDFDVFRGRLNELLR